MVATVAVFVDTTATPSDQDTTSLPNSPPNIRFKTADDFDIDANNPIPIPATGTKRSFWKSIFLKAIAGPFVQIDNVKFFTDGAGFGTGIQVFVGNELPVRTSISTAGYVQAVGVVGDDGTELVAGYTGITGKSDAFGFDTMTPKTITISETGSVIDAVGETTNYLVAQMDVDSTAGPGDLPNETWTFQYDEI